MTPKKDAPCIRCGALMWSYGKGSLPADERVCRSCRLAARMRQCEACGAEFKRHYTGDGRFCSVACSSRYRSSAGPMATCSDCGVATRNGANSLGRFCDECRQVRKRDVWTRKNHRRSELLPPERRGRGHGRAPKEKPWPSSKVYFVTCEICGVLKVKRSKGTTYCGSPQCYGVKHRRTHPGRKQRTCCGVELTGQRRKCDDCLAKVRREAKRRQKQKRRAAKFGAEHVPYKLTEIAARDGYMCGLCLKPVDMALRVPDSGAPTVDHVMPLSRGGADAPHNVQLAHFECNWRKGDRI